MNQRSLPGWMLALVPASLLLLSAPAVRADPPLHSQVVVFIPAYEGSKLYDPDLADKGEEAPCVWGSLDAIRKSRLYLALRNPNPLEARSMVTAGPIDVYSDFMTGLTQEQDVRGFEPYTEGGDFFTFAYDWRQEIASVTAPQLGKALEKYARIHEEKTGIPAPMTKFIIIGHSMGGLVARTFLSENPQWAERISAMYLVGTPNLGSVKAIKTLVVGPGGLKENAITFPASLLNFLPSTVDANLTKLVAVSRPSLYELLPFNDPRWECVAADGSRSRVSAQDMLRVGPWQNYWPSAELERSIFLDDWLKKQMAAGKKKISVADWEYCQDPDLPQLQKMLAATRDWRLRMGSLSYTSTLLTRPGEPSRLKLIVGTGLQTPTGVITEGSHDNSTARYTFEPDNDGDETVTVTSALDDLHPASDHILRVNNVTHGKLMTDPKSLDYFYSELAREKMAVPDARAAVNQTL